MKFRSDHHLLLELRAFSPAFGALLFFTAMITVLNFVPVIFMYQIFERVMHSRNISSLTSLFIIVIFLTGIWVALEATRSKTLQRIAFALDERISPRVFDALNRQTDTLTPSARGVILQDLNVVRDFLSSDLLIRLMDFLFVPLILIGAFLFHPVIGTCLLLLTLVVAGLALMSQLSTREDIRRSADASANANEFGRAVLGSTEAVRPQGMLPALVQLWRSRQREAIGWQYAATQRANIYSIILRMLRHLYAPIMLTCGTLLYIYELVGGGAIFAGSLLVIRAVGPVDIIANSWRVFWNATLAANRIDLLLREHAKIGEKVPLPTPNGPLVVSRVAAAPRNRDAMTLSDVSFTAHPGQIIAVVGASGAGKSTLARVLVNAWPIRRGSIMLDGHELAHWDQDQLGRHIGYVEQDVALLPGTVAQNISRFETPGPEVTRRLIDAIRLAAVQDIIGKLPNGLNTQLGPGGHILSSGQRQRIALARAVYGEPRLVVLDEPNSNLDSAGEQQLAATLTKLRDSGAIVILVTHRMNMLAYCDKVLVINAGTVQAFGGRDQVLDRLSTYRPKELTDNRQQTKPNDSTAAA
jgi:PrtD family type I secretion system ABC transporter